MSGLREKDEQISGNAPDIETRAADWLQQRHYWDWSPQDQAAFDAWLAESSAHRVAYLRLKAGYERTERLTVLRAAEPKTRGPGRPTLWRFAAAAIVLAMFGAAGATYFLGSKEIAYATPVGGHRIINLADGSQIELNTDTNLVLSVSGEKRLARLERGEAYFQIRHDASRPFVVETAGHHVTDLGTKFVVRSEAGRVEVALLEGRARFESDGASALHRVAILAPGNVAVATAATMSVTKEAPRNLTNDLGWRRGVLVFRNATLADAAAALNRYNDEKLIVADSSAAKFTINGTFRTHDVEFFARMAQDVFGLHITNIGGSTIISR